MKRIIIAISVIALSLCGLSNNANAQNNNWYVGVHGSLLYSGNENTKFADFADLINGAAYVSVGSDIDNLWGVRVMAGYGANTSASNYRESGRDYDDFYTLKDFSAFVDGTLNLSYLLNKRTDNALVVKAYAGVGAAYAWAYDEVKLGWYQLSDVEQFALGFRGGLNAEYRVSEKIGALVDAGLTAFQDNFNGVSAGVMFDLRASLSFGLIYHF